MNREKNLFSLLSLIRKAKKINITKIQKIMFIFSNEFIPGLFNYVANNFGPNSFEIKGDLDFLVSSNLIDQDESMDYTYYHYNDKSNPIFEKLIDKYREEDNFLGQIFEYWKDKSTKEIIEYVYYYYKEYTDMSLIYDQVMGGLNENRVRDAREYFKSIKKKENK